MSDDDDKKAKLKEWARRNPMKAAAVARGAMVASGAGLPPSIARIAGEVVADRMLELAGVLGRMVELLGSGPPRSFGQALEQACAELGVSVRKNSEEESALLRAAFQIIGSGRIPGAPDA